MRKCNAGQTRRRSILVTSEDLIRKTQKAVSMNNRYAPCRWKGGAVSMGVVRGWGVRERKIVGGDGFRSWESEVRGWQSTVRRAVVGKPELAVKARLYAGQVARLPSTPGKVDRGLPPHPASHHYGSLSSHDLWSTRAWVHSKPPDRPEAIQAELSRATVTPRRKLINFHPRRGRRDRWGMSSETLFITRACGRKS